MNSDSTFFPSALPRLVRNDQPNKIGSSFIQFSKMLQSTTLSWKEQMRIVVDITSKDTDALSQNYLSSKTQEVTPPTANATLSEQQAADSSVTLSSLSRQRSAERAGSPMSSISMEDSFSSDSFFDSSTTFDPEFRPKKCDSPILF